MHVAIVGGSDAGIEAARRCLELDPQVRVSLLVADAFPNYSICGIPYPSPARSRTGATSPTARPMTWRSWASR